MATVIPKIGAWKPKSRKTPEDEVKSIFNKLTLEKFEKLASRVIEIINSNVNDPFFDRICDLIVKKSQEDSKLVIVYVKLTKELIDNYKVFQDLILGKCQSAFESIGAMESWKRKGTLKFIGELYLISIINMNIFEFCIRRLIPDEKAAEENIESGCHLLSISAKKWEIDARDHSEDKTGLIRSFYEVLNRITKKADLSTRIKFAVQEILQSRIEGFKKVKQEPKTIKEIRSDAKKEGIIVREHSDIPSRHSKKPNRITRFNGGKRIMGSGMPRVHFKLPERLTPKPIRSSVMVKKVFTNEDQFLRFAKMGDVAKMHKMYDECCININYKGKSGYTAFHKAAWEGHKEVIDFLLSLKADINIKNDSGETAYETALAAKHHELAHYIKTCMSI